MKVLTVVLAVLALSSSAPTPRKPFHEHFEEFLDLIFEEAGSELDQLFVQYIEFDEFRSTLDYMTTADFKSLIYEMEDLPEFKAVIDFLENDNIDILYFIDLFNDALEQTFPRSRQTVSGRDLSAFIMDSIAQFPKDNLRALFDKKMEEDEEFRTAIDNLQSDEWDRIWSALWENETFMKEAQILAENGIDLRILLDELMAVFGLN